MLLMNVIVFSSRADGVIGAIIANAMLCLSKYCKCYALPIKVLPFALFMVWAAMGRSQSCLLIFLQHTYISMRLRLSLLVSIGSQGYVLLSLESVKG
jgi:hypothetical protein